MSQAYVRFAEHHPFSATVIETAALYGVNLALEHGARRVGLEIGHGRANDPGRLERIQRHPVVALLASTVVAPPLEEAIFRAGPQAIIDQMPEPQATRHRSTVRHIARLAFAASPQHLSRDGSRVVPLPQYLFGSYADEIYRRRGYRAAVVAHATYNAFGAIRIARRLRDRPAHAV